MAPERLEPFRQALVDLRRRLRDGALQPGERVTAKEVADQLKLSHTPVREALSRLAGEGLLEDRRGDGFFVPELSADDVAVLYRLGEQLLLMAHSATPPPPREGRGFEVRAEEDPVAVVERLFVGWVAEAGSRVIAEAYRTVTIRLAPLRRREVELIDDLAPEAEALVRLSAASERRARPPAIRSFHARRIALSPRLAELLAPRASEVG